MFSACFLHIPVLFNEPTIHPRLGHATKPSSPHRVLGAPPDLAMLPPSHLLHLQAPSLRCMNFYSSLTVMLSPHCRAFAHAVLLSTPTVPTHPLEQFTT